MIRTFLAVELPVPLKEVIAAIQKRMRERLERELPSGSRLQWVKPEAIHLTVKFLGDIPEAQVDELKPAVAAVLAGAPPFSLDLAGCGVFPDPRAPRVLWLGLQDREREAGGRQRLLDLAAAVEAAVERLGHPREGRPFAAHLTVARIKDGHREVGKALARGNLLSASDRYGEVTVSSLALMKSELHPSGAVYSRLWEVPLGASGGE